jgi:hypothetical protein
MPPRPTAPHPSGWREICLGLALAAGAAAAGGGSALAQDNYEIQVYAAETVAPGATMFELHTNYTFRGDDEAAEGVRSTSGALHETLEITHGFSDYFEAALYTFTSAGAGYGWDWVGNHIRLRARAPTAWDWPVGMSLSTEFGYQRRVFSPDTLTLEIRPIVDKQLGRWYFAFNPTFDRSFRGLSTDMGLVFSPNVKVGYDFTRQVNAGLEYYGSLGPLNSFDPLREQQQQIVPALDLNLDPNWELNFGVAFGVTHATDHLLLKMIIGRRIGFHTSGNPSP